MNTTVIPASVTLANVTTPKRGMTPRAKRGKAADWHADALQVMAAELQEMGATYANRLITAHDALKAMGVSMEQLKKTGSDIRARWLSGIGRTYLSPAEFKVWTGPGLVRSKALETEGNKNGLTEKGHLNNRVSARSGTVLADLAKVFAAKGLTTADKVAAAKGAKGNTERPLETRIPEEQSALIKAVERDALAEVPKFARHREMVAALTVAADLAVEIGKAMKGPAPVARKRPAPKRPTA